MAGAGCCCHSRITGRYCGYCHFERARNLDVQTTVISSAARNLDASISKRRDLSLPSNDKRAGPLLSERASNIDVQTTVISSVARNLAFPSFGVIAVATGTCTPLNYALAIQRE